MAAVAVATPVGLPRSKDDVPLLGDASALIQDTLPTPEATPEATAPAQDSLKEEEHQSRDPHVLPTFSRRSQSPILYLPPLLSSLPVGIVHPNYPISSPAFSSPSAPRPLSTDSRLPSIDTASLSLHRALHNFRPVTAEYAMTPYTEAFNWDELELPEEEEREWYTVAFRSKRREGSDGGREQRTGPWLYAPYTHTTCLHSTALYEADKQAHEEAVQNGGVRVPVTFME